MYTHMYMYVGGVGNQVEMQGCVFSGNRGHQGGPSDYGAAVALSLLNPLVDRTNFPRHLVSNWYVHTTPANLHPSQPSCPGSSVGRAATS